MGIASRSQLLHLMNQFIIAAGSGIGVQELNLAHSATITWTASTDPVDGYNIYRANTSGTEAPPPLNGSTLVNATTFTDTTVQVGKAYFYVVTSVVNGFESAHSNEATSTVILPAAPTDVIVSTVN